MLKIGSVALGGNRILAPMAGYGDVAFRKLCREYGADLTVTEMISVKGLLHNGKKTEEMLRLAPNETPSCVQLFGSDPDEFARVLAECEYLRPFDIVDINMGCPVPKVTKQGEGSALMKDPLRAAAIVSACKRATDKPVTVKFRLGWTENTALDFALRMQDAGADMVTVHGRTAEQMYRGSSDVAAVLDLKKHLSVPLVVSGDANETNGDLYAAADGIMYGRSALGHPDIFAELRGERRQPIYPVIRRHIQYMLDYFPSERYVVANMRKHLGYYLKRAGASGEQKNRANLAPDLASLTEVLDEIFAQENQK